MTEQTTTARLRDAMSEGDDVAWLLEYVERDADVCSMVNGSDDEATREARRIETTVKRLAREAGYIPRG